MNIVYLRVSHTESLNGTSLEVQEKKCRAFAELHGFSIDKVYQEVVFLVKKEYAFIIPIESKTLPGENVISLSPNGWSEACRIVRNHRLWELYLTDEVQYSPDHVHDDAEKIEHVLGDETVRKIERILSNPTRDPHGKLIPSQKDIEQGYVTKQIAKNLI